MFYLCELVCPFCMVGEIYVLFVWSVYCVSCLSGLGVICLVCLGCLSFLPTSFIASVLCTCISMYCIVKSVNISITRITRVNNICFCYVAISNDVSTHANFEVDGYHGC